MKNKFIKILLLIIILGTLLTLLIFVGKLLWKKSIEKDKYDYFVKTMSEIKNPPIFERMEVRSTTDGFPSNGSTYIIYYFNNEDGKYIESQIKQNQHWKIKDDSKETNHYMTKSEMKEVKNGYYLFCNLDFNIKVFDRYDDFHNIELGGKYPEEYKVLVFDTDNNVMYYYQWDT